jgi:predicted site-specific integrase-resolvase
MNTHLMTRSETADYLRVSCKTVDRWAREGLLTPLTVPGLRSVRYARHDLADLFAPRHESEEA